ncbi:hypothetical protein ACFX5E_04710 [Flavobacterium sp. LS2P90]|uniref:Apea-like HEPN domain-containing protein n=1 Tax=Flavobacterium xylosi TaxID=3230415 RepID=A0ABW6HUA9_9FLAO
MKNNDILNENQIKSKLIFSTIFITSFELLSNLIITNLKGHICYDCIILKSDNSFDFKDCEIYLNTIKNIKHKELKNSKNEFYSCCKWYLKEEIIDLNEFNKIQEIRKYRNKLSHDFTNILLNNEIEINEELIIELKIILQKIGEFWFKIELDITNIDSINSKIEPNIISVKLVEYLEGILQSEKTSTRDSLKQ